MKAAVTIALDWAVRCFGQSHVYHWPTRSLRILEEAAELAQALDVSEAVLHQVVSNVYKRPPGDKNQELGGVLMTASLLSAAMGYDPDEVLLRELMRVLAKSPVHFQIRNQEKINLIEA